MANKILANGIAVYHTDPDVAYTAPANGAIISKIIVWNSSSASSPTELFKIEVLNQDSGVTTTLYRGNLNGKETLEVTGGITLQSGSTITVTGDLDSFGIDVHVTIFGAEL